jgi:DNA-binding response OmpR family regulator
MMSDKTLWCTAEDQPIGKKDMNQTQSTILVVDDDPGVQRLAAQVLRNEGYKVLVASDTPEAMQAADEHPAAIELLLTDIMLPSGNGISLASSLLAKRPDTSVLYMSGFTADAIQAVQHEAGPNGGFLEKPFLPRTLIDRVRMIVAPNERQVPLPVPVHPEPVLAAAAAVQADAGSGAGSDAVYRLESTARCPQCGETISTLRAVRLLRTQVNFTSTLPRRGRIITCPCCSSIVPAELTNF